MGGVVSLVLRCLFDLEGPGDIALGVGDGAGGGGGGTRLFDL